MFILYGNKTIAAGINNFRSFFVNFDVHIYFNLFAVLVTVYCTLFMHFHKFVDKRGFLYGEK